MGDGNDFFTNGEELKTAVRAYIGGGAYYVYTGGIRVYFTDLGPIGTWCTSGITVMSDLFKDRSSFNEDIGLWDVSSVTTMASMFRNARAFNQNIGSWNTSSVVNMQTVFFGARAFNQDISGWTVSSVTTMLAMFRDAFDFSQNLCLWKDAPAVNNGESMFARSQGGPTSDGSTFDAALCVSVVKVMIRLLRIP